MGQSTGSLALCHGAILSQHLLQKNKETQFNSTFANVLPTGYFYVKINLNDCNTPHPLFETKGRIPSCVYPK
jgi:hypothetical protein